MANDRKIYIKQKQDFLYTNPTPMPSPVGGYETGTTFESKTIKNMFDGLLYPYQYPSFSSFIIVGQSAILEVGDAIAANRTFNWATTQNANITPNTISISNSTSGGSLANNIANSGSFVATHPAISKTAIATNSFKIQGVNTNNDIFSKTYTVSWRWRLHFGESLTDTNLSETDVKALRINRLDTTFKGTHAFNGGGYKYIAYPTVWGKITKFNDAATQLEVPFKEAYTISVTNAFGISTTYWVHRSVNILNGAINIIII